MLFFNRRSVTVKPAGAAIRTQTLTGVVANYVGVLTVVTFVVPAAVAFKQTSLVASTGDIVHPDLKRARMDGHDNN